MTFLTTDGLFLPIPAAPPDAPRRRRPPPRAESPHRTPRSRPGLRGTQNGPGEGTGVLLVVDGPHVSDENWSTRLVLSFQEVSSFVYAICHPEIQINGFFSEMPHFCHGR